MGFEFENQNKFESKLGVFKVSRHYLLMEPRFPAHKTPADSKCQSYCSEQKSLNFEQFWRFSEIFQRFLQSASGNAC